MGDTCARPGLLCICLHPVPKVDPISQLIWFLIYTLSQALPSAVHQEHSDPEGPAGGGWEEDIVPEPCEG